MAGTVHALPSMGPGGVLRVEHLTGEPGGSPGAEGFYELDAIGEFAAAGLGAR